MKKFTIFVLVTLMLMSLVSCVTTDFNSDTLNNDTSIDTETKESEPIEETEPEIIETVVEKDTITFTSQVVVDNEICKIEIINVEEDDWWGGYTFKVKVENRSDMTLCFATDDGFINGVEESCYFHETVTAGKTAIDTMSVRKQDINRDENLYTDIEIEFRVYEDENYTADDLWKGTTNIYLYGEDKAIKYSYKESENDFVIVDTDYIKIVVLKYYETEYCGLVIDFYVENKTGTEILTFADDVSINNMMIDPVFAASVDAHKCKFTTMDWSTTQFSDNEIDIAEVIEFVLTAHEYFNYSDEAEYYNDTVVLNP